METREDMLLQLRSRYNSVSAPGVCANGKPRRRMLQIKRCHVRCCLFLLAHFLLHYGASYLSGGLMLW